MVSITPNWRAGCMLLLTVWSSLGSWQRNEKGHFLSLSRTGSPLVRMLREMGLPRWMMPISEHPLTDLGLQPWIFWVSPTLGSPRFAFWLMHSSANMVYFRLGAGHFQKHDWHCALWWHRIVRHEDPRLGEHRTGVLIFQLWRNEVRNF